MAITPWLEGIHIHSYTITNANINNNICMYVCLYVCMYGYRARNENSSTDGK